VGILTKSSLDFEVLDRVDDVEENFLLIKAKIQGKELILGSIYGPNEHNHNFFISLFNCIHGLGNLPIILAGDWNCTFSNAPILYNNDCLNMNSLPNLRHSNYISELCEDLDLMDPFRGFHPTAIEFTYSPFGTTRTNKSRIDFFLISRDLFGTATGCNIALSLQSKLFDHKAVNLSFRKHRKIN